MLVLDKLDTTSTDSSPKRQVDTVTRQKGVEIGAALVCRSTDGDYDCSHSSCQHKIKLRDKKQFMAVGHVAQQRATC